MDTQLKDFSQENFSASAAAHRFFADHTDKEVHGKLNDLAALQTKTEATLRETVAENYGSFVRANSEIRSLGGEMVDLKDLVAANLKLVQDLKATKILDAKSLRNGDEIAVGFATSESKEYSNDNPLSRIPKWVSGASTELDRLIIEHRYLQAAQLINRTQDYYDAVVSSSGSSSEVKGPNGKELDRLREISIRVKEKGAVLAQVLKTSIMRLPNSELWGASELYRQLRLLIQLGYRKAAADGFVKTQVELIRKALRSVDVSGDPGLYTTELSRVFFLCLERACKGFVELFSNSSINSEAGNGGKGKSTAGHRPSVRPSRRESKGPRGSMTGGGTKGLPIPLDVLAHLLSWIHSQISDFASVLARQIQLGASEYADIMFERYSDWYRSSSPRFSFHSFHRASSIGNQRDSVGSVGRISRSESVSRHSALGKPVLSS